MPVAIGDGVLGLEATHVWNPPQGRVGGGIPAITLNDLGALGSEAVYLVNSISGLHALGDIEDLREPATGRMGEVIYQSLMRGKTIVYSGTIHAPTLQELRAAANAMRRSFGSLSIEHGFVSLQQPSEGRMEVYPHASYGSLHHFYYARTLSLELGDEQTAGPDATPSPYQRPFVLSLRMADPRFYLFDPVESLGNADGATVAVTNDGSAPTDPFFEVTGVLAGVGLYSFGDFDAQLVFADLGFTGTLRIDFAQRRAWRVSDGVDFTAKLAVDDSTWWDPGVTGLDAGPNSISVTGGTWDLTFFHASY